MELLKGITQDICFLISKIHAVYDDSIFDSRVCFIEFLAREIFLISSQLVVLETLLSREN